MATYLAAAAHGTQPADAPAYTDTLTQSDREADIVLAPILMSNIIAAD